MARGSDIGIESRGIDGLHGAHELALRFARAN